MTDRVVARSAGVCVLRDAVDIVPALCGHYLRMGLERIRFVDDGSTDGTAELLEWVARRRGRLEVERVQRPHFDQAALVTAAANDLIATGSRLILPFDADEFWHLTRGRVADLVARDVPRLIVGRWTNFVQSRRVIRPRSWTLFSARYRMPESDATQEEVLSLERPWLAFAERKVAFWSREPVEIALGQHGLTGGPALDDEPELELFHLPLRSKAELAKRAFNYEPRRAGVRDPGYSWQSSFHREAVVTGRSDAVWAANSADARGRLDVFGRPVELIPDRRLQRLLLAAVVYLWMRCGPTPIRWPEPLSAKPG